MAESRKPIPPNPSRWKPSPNPASIAVPGLDADASAIDQIEQIEQLITIKLQNIDENFSKIHNVLANKILPAVKRYAIGTEPVREAAKFWTSFYEQAAQIRIPSYDDDYSTVNDVPSDRGESTTDQDRTTSSQESDENREEFEPSIAQTDNSFFPGQAAFSSTPATVRVARTLDSFATQDENDSSWTNSMESPLHRLKSEIENFSTEDDSILTTGPASTFSSIQPTGTPSEPPDTTILSSPTKGKGKEPEHLLRDVLRHNLYNANPSSEGFTAKSVSPLKFRGKPKTPVSKNLNPYLPPDTDPDKWSGVVDLRDPSVMTPQRFRSTKSSSHRKLKTPVPDDSDDDDSFDGLPEGMSPPVLMSPARPPRSSAELGLLKLGQSPSKQAAARIAQDLVRDVQRNSAFKSRGYYGITSSAVESSMSTVQTPPSLSRYHQADTSDSVADSTLESMIRRVGLNVPSMAGLASTPGLRLRPRTGLPNTRAATTTTDHRPPEEGVDEDRGSPVHTPYTPNYLDDYQHQDTDSDSDSLDLDEVNNTAHPSAAFLMASQGRPGEDDSFGSSNHSSDSLTDEDVGGLVPVYPFAGGVVEDNGFDDDDSFDYDEGEVQEETVFGVPPAQRMRAQAAAGQRPPSEGLRLLGENLLDDTIGAQIVAGVGGVEESPTPAWGGSGALRH